MHMSIYPASISISGSAELDTGGGWNKQGIPQKRRLRSLRGSEQEEAGVRISAVSGLILGMRQTGRVWDHCAKDTAAHCYGESLCAARRRAVLQASVSSFLEPLRSLDPAGRVILVYVGTQEDQVAGLPVICAPLSPAISSETELKSTTSWLLP